MIVFDDGIGSVLGLDRHYEIRYRGILEDKARLVGIEENHIIVAIHPVAGPVDGHILRFHIDAGGAVGRRGCEVIGVVAVGRVVLQVVAAQLLVVVAQAVALVVVATARLAVVGW